MTACRPPYGWMGLQANCCWEGIGDEEGTACILKYGISWLYLLISPLLNALHLLKMILQESLDWQHIPVAHANRVSRVLTICVIPAGVSPLRCAYTRAKANVRAVVEKMEYAFFRCKGYSWQATAKIRRLALLLLPESFLPALEQPC